MEPHFKIITPVYNAERWISKCIESVKRQTYTDFQHIIIDDNSTDNTYKVAQDIADDDRRIFVYKTQKRYGVPLNQRAGVKISSALSEDVIVQLDGDDWFYDETALEKVAKLYDEKDCWLTYGSYITSNGDPSIARFYNGPPRQAPLDNWPFSHLRTVKKHAWDHLTEENFMDQKGNYYTAAADVVIFVPILEAIGYDRVEFCEDILVVYNLDHNNHEHETNLNEQVRTVYDVISK